jgi:predicted dienelactone hydrolase
MFIKRIIKWLLRGLAAIVLLAVVSLILLLVFLSREHRTEITLPQPSGRFAVGRTSYVWTNQAETDELAPSAGTPRELMVWIWYPAAPGASAQPAAYLPAPWRAAEARYSGALMLKFLTRDLSLVRAHSSSDPDVSPEQPSYPVVILRAGGGAFTTDYTTLGEDLASHGYVVVGFDAPYRTSLVVFPDGHVVERTPANNPENLNAEEANRLINRLLPMWTGDTKFVLSQLQRLNDKDNSSKFAGRLDMERVGMFGHSFGGATTLQFCHDDARCKAALDLDGAPYGSVVQEGLQQSCMFIFSDHSRELSDPAAKQVLADLQSLYGHLPNGRVVITIGGAHHFSFSDQSLLKSPLLMRVLTSLAGFGKLDARRGLAITSTYVHTFFDVHLKGSPASELTDISAQYPEVRVEQR